MEMSSIKNTSSTSSELKGKPQSLPPRPIRANSLALSGSIDFTTKESHKSNHSSSCVESDSESNISYDASCSGAAYEDGSVYTKRLFLDAIQRRRNSLTNKEFSFLENMAHDDDEEFQDKLNVAMMIISDKSLFFNKPSPKKIIMDSLRNVFACSDVSNVNMENSILQHTIDYELQKLRKLHGNSNSVPQEMEKKEADHCSFHNIELVVGEEGVIVLQDLARSITDQHNVRPEDSENNDASETEDKNITPVDKIGSSLRRSIVHERRESHVHASMWKAHESGISLTPISFSNINKTRLKRSTSFKRRLFVSDARHSDKTNSSISARPRRLSSVLRRNERSIGAHPPLHPGQSILSHRTSNDSFAHHGSIQLHDISHLSSIDQFEDSSISFSSLPQGASLHQESQRQLFVDHLGESIISLSDTPSQRGKMSESTIDSLGESFPSLYQGMPLQNQSGRHSDLNSSLRSLQYDEPNEKEDVPLKEFSLSARTPFEEKPSCQLFTTAIGDTPNNVTARIIDSPVVHSLDLAYTVRSIDATRIAQMRSKIESIQTVPSLDLATPIKSKDVMIMRGRDASYPSRRYSELLHDSTKSFASLNMANQVHDNVSQCSESSISLNPLSRPVSFRRQLSYGSNSSTSSRHQSPPQIRLHRPSVPLRGRSTGSTRVVSPIKEESFHSTSSHLKKEAFHLSDSATSIMTPLETIPSQDTQIFKMWLQSGEGNIKEDAVNVFEESGERYPSQPILRPSPMLRASVGSNNSSRSDIFVSNDSNNVKSIDTVLRLERMNSMRRYGSLLSSVNTSKSSMNENPLRNSGLSSQKDLASDCYVHRHDIPNVEDNFDLNCSNVDVSSIIDDHFDDEVNQTADDIDMDWKHNIWNVLSDDCEEYGYGRRSLPFQILGTSANDEASHPHCLSPPLMESLSNFLPYSLTHQNFWMKYSLVRDGASLFTLLQNVRASKHTLIALETTGGDVFGAFTSTPWKKCSNYFGSGESFLWKMRSGRKTLSKSIIDQAKIESEIEVFSWTGKNDYNQLCTDNTFAVGCSSSDGAGSFENDKLFCDGFGLAIDDALLHGTSNYCQTFDNPPLSSCHQDGSPFEILNLEIWTFTPAMNIKEAEKIEFGRLFLDLPRQ